MIKKICDRCSKVDEIKGWGMEKVKRFIYPEDKSLKDLCEECEKELIAKQKELHDEQMLESMRLNCKFWGVEIEEGE